MKVRDNIYMLVGAGGNQTVHFGDEGVLVVDTQFAPLSAKLLAAIREVTDAPIRHIVNTHLHGDHIGGNENFAKAGRFRAGGNVLGDIGGAATATAHIIAHENVLTRLSAPPAAGQTQVPFAAWPNETFFGKKREFLFNGEAVQIIHQPSAHTDGDTVVFFRRSDVLSTGDLFTTVMYPFIDVANGGTIDGYVNALNAILDITVASNVNEGGTMVIPGHGRLSDEQDVIEYRDMATIVRDRIREYVKRGMTHGPGEGEEADARLRRTLRHHHRLLDHELVHRDDLQGNGRQAQAAGPARGHPAEPAPESKPEQERPMRAVQERCRTAGGDCRRGCRCSVAGAELPRPAWPRRWPAAGPPAQTAPVDLAGNWVSIVTEDWQWRMRTPSKGDYDQRAVDAGGHAGGRHVDRRQGRPVRGLRGRRIDAHARAPAHQLAGRQHAEDRDPTPASRRACCGSPSLRARRRARSRPSRARDRCRARRLPSGSAPAAPSTPSWSGAAMPLPASGGGP